MLKKSLFLSLTVCALVLTGFDGISPAMTPEPARTMATPFQTRPEGLVGRGQPLGASWFPISFIINEPGHYYEEFPAVAYNSVQKEYLVVWERQYDDLGNRAIYGRRLTKDGGWASSWFGISPFSGVNHHAAVAYDSVHNNYLVVYQVDGMGIMGQRIGGSGGFVGVEFTIAGGGGYTYHEPAVAYSTSSILFDHYLITWRKDQGTAFKGIETRSVSGFGTTMSPVVEITGLLANVEPSKPDVAYNGALDQFLVVWQKWYNSGSILTDRDIYGQRIHLEGGAHREGYALEIFSTADDEIAPSVGALAEPPGSGQYLVACQRVSLGGSFIDGRRVSGNGVLGSPWQISPSFGHIPVVAGGENIKDYLVVWEYGGEILVRRFTSEGNPEGPTVALPGTFPSNPAVVGGPSGDFLIVADAVYLPGYPIDVLGWLWGNRLYLPLILKP